MARALRIAIVVLGACGDSPSAPEVVIADASLGGAMPQLVGATATTVFWSASAAGTTHVGGGSLASLPAIGMELATTTGPVAHAGDYVAFLADRSVISRVDGAGTVARITSGNAEMIGGGPGAVIAWSVGATVSWGADEVQTAVTLTKIDTCDHARVTEQQVYVAADGLSGRRLLRIDQRTAMVTPMTASATWAPMFPGGAADGATYRGRIVAADDDGALWLVEEMPSGRGIVVSLPVVGEPFVLLEHVSHATGFFASTDALYWQEGAELLTAQRSGGAASIVDTLPGAAGAFADGYVYFTHGTAIERLRVE